MENEAIGKARILDLAICHHEQGILRENFEAFRELHSKEAIQRGKASWSRFQAFGESEESCIRAAHLDIAYEFIRQAYKTWQPFMGEELATQMLSALVGVAAYSVKKQEEETTPTNL